MADEEQLAIFRRGSDVWNAWRKQNPDLRVDLMNADLSRVRKRGVSWLT